MHLFEAFNIECGTGGRRLFTAERLVIRENERIGLVGRNGCGKTTLLEVIAGIREPDAGTAVRRALVQLLPQMKETETTKSGGEVTQQYIQKALTGNAALLLADEPTTNLDAGHIEWLEKKLSDWPGAFVLVSHDRAFLDMLCTTIWAIDGELVISYSGNYSAYAAQKEVQLTERRRAYDSYEKQKRQLEAAIKLKEHKAQRATKKPKHVNLSESHGSEPYFAKKQKKLQKTASSLHTRLEKLERVEKPQEIRPLKMVLPNAETFKKRMVLRADHVSARFGSRVLWHDASFLVRGGDKLAIVGPNGSGKTTLIRKIIEKAPGITYSPAVKIGYFSQNLSLLNPVKSIIDNVMVSAKQEETVARTVLATGILSIRDRNIHLFSGSYRQWQQARPNPGSEERKERLLVLDTQMAAVLSRLSLEPSAELEAEFQRLLQEKKKLQQS